jgi:NAD(P)-dependent dehydrogenase (short-subunit alcohol dehydrogenase family)
MNLGFDDKVVLVVGGARGIGYAAAEELSAAGARVVLADIDGAGAEEAAQRLAGSSGQQTLGLRVDVTSVEEISQAIEKIKARFGPIDALLISAAVLDDKLFLDSQPSDWRRMIDVCLYGPMNVLHAVLPQMVERGSGRIVCMATDAARVGQARLSYYAAAKAGVIALVKSIAQEVGRHGISLNIVSPGATVTELRQHREATLKAQMGDEAYDKRVTTVNRMYPLRRIGVPDDHSPIISLLLSERSSWITGQVFSVNGGFVMP